MLRQDAIVTRTRATMRPAKSRRTIMGAGMSSESMSGGKAVVRPLLDRPQDFQASLERMPELEEPALPHVPIEEVASIWTLVKRSPSQGRVSGRGGACRRDVTRHTHAPGHG
jgi:hypothetical protein